MSEYFFISKELFKGRSLLRAYLNLRLTKEILRGDTIDVGGGVGQKYLDSIGKESNLVFKNFDRKTGAEIDFEKDQLPAADGQYDTVLFLNVMEHIFNYQHIANEVVRITKPGGQLIGYVPFLMWYHPDHKDFFRYTHEALEIILQRTGAKKFSIEAIAPGPFTAGANMFITILPSFLAPLFFLPFFLLDMVYVRIKPAARERYPLGYVFKINK